MADDYVIVQLDHGEAVDVQYTTKDLVGWKVMQMIGNAEHTVLTQVIQQGRDCDGHPKTTSIVTLSH